MAAESAKRASARADEKEGRDAYKAELKAAETREEKKAIMTKYRDMMRAKRAEAWTKRDQIDEERAADRIRRNKRRADRALKRKQRRDKRAADKKLKETERESKNSNR